VLLWDHSARHGQSSDKLCRIPVTRGGDIAAAAAPAVFPGAFCVLGFELDVDREA